MARFIAPDLTGLAPPDVIEELDYEDILQDLKDDIIARMATMGVDYDVSMLESDPVVKVLEVAAYREIILRSRVNTAARAVMLASSQQSDLEHLGVYYGVERADGELDDRLRERIQIAPEAFSTAGALGAYRFHAMTVDPTIKSVHAYHHSPGNIHVLPLVSTGDGIPSQSLLSKIRHRLHEEDIKPLTDVVTVLAPTKLEYEISIELIVEPGPDASLIKSTAQASVLGYLSRRHKVGTSITRSGIIAAAHVSGVESVNLVLPSLDVEPKEFEVAYHTSLTVSTIT